MSIYIGHLAEVTRLDLTHVLHRPVEVAAQFGHSL